MTRPFLHLGDQTVCGTHADLSGFDARRSKSAGRPMDYVDLRFGSRVFLKDRK